MSTIVPRIARRSHHREPGFAVWLAATASILVASVAGCGGSTRTEGPTDPGPTAAASTAGDAPSDQSPASAMVVTRTGGIAGVHDVIQVGADGTAQVTSRTGESRRCTPSPAAVDGLRAIDLAAVGSATSKSPVRDGFNYSVEAAGVIAAAGDGETDGLRAEFVSAAAAVVSSCLASQAGSDLEVQ